MKVPLGMFPSSAYDWAGPVRSERSLVVAYVPPVAVDEVIGVWAAGVVMVVGVVVASDDGAVSRGEQVRSGSPRSDPMSRSVPPLSLQVRFLALARTAPDQEPTAMLDTHRLEPRSRPLTCDARVLVTGRIGFRHPTRYRSGLVRRPQVVY
jgi:hypothetical protein